MPADEGGAGPAGPGGGRTRIRSSLTDPVGPIRAWWRSVRHAFAAISGNRSIVRLEAAYAAGVTATALLQVGLVVVAFDAFGPAGIALLTVAQMVPAMLFVPLIAGLGDRVRRERLLVASLVVYAISVLLTAAALTIPGPAWVVLLLAGVGTTAAGTTWATRGAVLPAVARTPEELIAGNVTSTLSDGVAALVGPLLAAGLLLAWGPAVTAWAAAVLLAGGRTGSRRSSSRRSAHAPCSSR